MCLSTDTPDIESPAAPVAPVVDDPKVLKVETPQVNQQKKNKQRLKVTSTNTGVNANSNSSNGSGSGLKVNR